ncbi:MAG: methyltransferase domain-containing protein [Nitrospina sp.]|nr:methyltransferase domain-containing protein [Nitrospina sp.]
MGKEIDLMANYPKAKRNIERRAAEKTNEERNIARQFGRDFFDGDRRYGYGGYSYHDRFWEGVIPTFKNFYNLKNESKVLDVGCGKGFMLYDFMRLIKGITVAGIDVSEYAIANAKDEVKPFVKLGDARELPFDDDSFDLVISITTVHNLEREDCKKALQEIERVSSNGKFITVDAYFNDDEKKRMDMWNLTALTYMHTDEWNDFFQEAGYTGDYYWFIP